MTRTIRSLLASALLLITGAFGSAVQSTHGHAAPEGIDPDILQRRYQRIWDSVRGKGPTKLPSLVVHLGASTGNRITVWAKSVNGRGAARNWALTCTGTNAVSVEEEVHDALFGVSKLVITRNDGNDARLQCDVSMGGNSAALVVPVLSTSPDQTRFSFLAYSCNENQVGRFEVRPAGKINDSASFAELIVDLGAPDQPPKVDLVFHLNGTRMSGGVAIGNTNLLATRDHPLWYHTYRYAQTMRLSLRNSIRKR